MLRIALNESEGGVKIKYTVDGEIRARTLAEAEEIDELILSLLYADDMAIVTEDPLCLEKIVVKLDEVMSLWGLEVSPEKTEILTVDRNSKTNPPSITLRGKKLKNVEKFKYLGTYFTARPMAKTVSKRKEPKKKSRKKAPKQAPKTSFLNANLDNRLAKASGSFYRYAAPLYRRGDIPLRHKVKVFKMTALPTLLYGSEVWAPSKDEIKRLETWQNDCMRYMMGIWYSKHGNVPTDELRRKCKLRKVEELLRIRRLRWLGHAARMSPDRLPKKMLTGQLGRTRPRGRTRMSWRKIINEDLQAIECDDYPMLAADRKEWRKKIIGPYTARAEVAPSRRSQRLAVQGRK